LAAGWGSGEADTVTLTTPQGFGVGPMPEHPPPSEANTLARLALTRYLAVQPGESVTIEAWTHALPWALPFVLEARRLGSEPALLVEDEETFFRSLATRGDRPRGKAPVAPVPSADAYVYFGGPDDFPRLFGLPDDDLEAVVDRHGIDWWRAARRSRLRAARMAIATATETAARRYGVDRGAWQREILAASRVTPDRLAPSGRRWIRRLARARTLRIRHPNGTDLSARISPRPAILEDGRVDRDDLAAGRFWTQIPTGIVAVPLRWSDTEGTWEANRPGYDRWADPPVALGARFEFSRGRLRQFAFDRGGEPFAASYAVGGPGRDRVGAVTVGLNSGIDHAPELADIARGSVSLLLGNDRALGGRNRTAFAYLSTLAGATVELDDVPWLVDGREVGPRGERHRAPGPGRPKARKREP
jgi:leucyl aminopeptidase (aminopeptidase T)